MNGILKGVCIYYRLNLCHGFVAFEFVICVSFFYACIPTYVRAPHNDSVQGHSVAILAIATVALSISFVFPAFSHLQSLAASQILPTIAKLAGVSLAPLPSSKGLPSIIAETLWSERPHIILCTRRPG